MKWSICQVTNFLSSCKKGIPEPSLFCITNSLKEKRNPYLRMEEHEIIQSMLTFIETVLNWAIISTKWANNLCKNMEYMKLSSVIGKNL